MTTVTVELSGGLELIFGGETEFDVTLPSLESSSSSSVSNFSSTKQGSSSPSEAAAASPLVQDGMAEEVNGSDASISGKGGDQQGEEDTTFHTVKDVIAHLAKHKVKVNGWQSN